MSQHLRIGDQLRQTYSMSHPEFPGDHFEWHPDSKHVFYCRKGSTVGIDMGAAGSAEFARLLVTVWTRGYLYRKRHVEEAH